MNPLILSIGAGIVILILTGIGVALNVSGKKARAQRAMTVIKGHAATAVEKKGKGNEQDRRRNELAKKLKEQEDEIVGKKKKKEGLPDKLVQAGMKISAKQFWLFSVIFAVALTLVVKLVLNASAFSTLMAFIVGLIGLPRMFLKRKIKKRQKKFLEEFADALESMVRLLKAGMPVTEAIAMAGREFVGPVGDEMSRIYDEQKVGVSLPEAVLGSARRMPITEMQMFATGIAIQQQTGASLSEVLTNLAGVIRARYKLARKVKALSSEAKSSAGIIGSLPFLICGGMYLINPDQVLILFTTTAGKVMLICAGIWMSLGILCMKMMINFKV
jgi:tight adherence protein B